MRKQLMKSLLVFLLLFPFFSWAESVRVQVIDRGQADGILIRTPVEKKWIVIDAGTNKQQAQAMLNWGIERIELAIVTHRHFDHMGGMDNVLTRFDIGEYIGIDQSCNDSKSMNEVLKAISDHNIPVADLSDTPLIYEIDGIKLTVLPVPTPHADCPQHENMNSIVVRLDYGEFSMLMAGDTEDESLDWLVDNFPELLDVDVLKASHHGSNNGYTEAFLDAVTPEAVVISAGVHGTYKHPMKEATQAYSSVSNGHLYCTNRQGTIRVYGYKGGKSFIREQFENNKSCVYDGTHY